MSRRAHAILRLPSVALLLLLAACADLKALTSLVGAIRNEYHVPVNANVSGSRLVLLFPQLPDAKLSPEERAEFARGVARFARAHYTGTPPLTDISVGIVQRSGAGPLTITKTSVPYHFTVAELDDTTRVDVAGAAGPLVDLSAQGGVAESAAAGGGAFPHRLTACPGFVAARAGGADSINIDPVGTVGADAPAAVRYPTSLAGPHAPTGRVTLEYVLGASGAPDMRTARVLSSTGDPFTLAACDALRRSREPVSTSIATGHPVRTVQRRTFVVRPS
jgi:hypothetical protein